MNKFQLDSRLAEDCFYLGEVTSGMLLLSKNASVLWTIIVPRLEGDEDVVDFTDLPQDQQHRILDDAKQIAGVMKSQYQVDKINVGSIGNVVSQMHYHVVGRFQSDPYWPGVVWGQTAQRSYQDNEVQTLKAKLLDSGVITDS